MAKKASVDSEAEPRRKRRNRCITEVDKIICHVLAGAQAMQLILPYGESADLALASRQGCTLSQHQGPDNTPIHTLTHKYIDAK